MRFKREVIAPRYQEGRVIAYRFSPDAGQQHFQTDDENGVTVVPAIDAALAAMRNKFPNYDMQLAVYDGTSRKYPNFGTFAAPTLGDFIRDDVYEYSNMPSFDNIIQFSIYAFPKPAGDGGDGFGIKHDCMWKAILTANAGKPPPFTRPVFDAASFKAHLGLKRDARVPASMAAQIDRLLGASVRLELSGEAAYVSAKVSKTLAMRTLKIRLEGRHYFTERAAGFWALSPLRWHKQCPQPADQQLMHDLTAAAEPRFSYLANQLRRWHQAAGTMAALPTSALANYSLMLPEPDALTGQEEVWVAMATKTALMLGDRKEVAAEPLTPGHVVQKYDVCSSYPAAACSTQRLPFAEGTFSVASYWDANRKSYLSGNKSALPQCIVRVAAVEFDAPGPRLFRLPTGVRSRKSKATGQPLASLPGDYWARQDVYAAWAAGAKLVLADDGQPNMLSWKGAQCMPADAVFKWMRKMYDFRRSLKAVGRDDLAAPIKAVLNGTIGMLAVKRTLKAGDEIIMEKYGGIFPGRVIGGRIGPESQADTVWTMKTPGSYFRMPTARWAPLIQSEARRHVCEIVRAQLAAADVKLRRVYIDGWVLEGTPAEIAKATAALPGGGPSNDLGAVKLET